MFTLDYNQLLALAKELFPNADLAIEHGKRNKDSESYDCLVYRDNGNYRGSITLTMGKEQQFMRYRSIYGGNSPWLELTENNHKSLIEHALQWFGAKN